MVDWLINTIEHAFKALQPETSDRDFKQVQPYFMPEQDRKLAARLMRVDHVGEICAQALYKAQILTASSDTLKKTLSAAKNEEKDHLVWCQRALDRLDSSPSLILEVWAASSFLIAIQMSFLSDEQNAAFLETTEEYVSNHIEDHLKKMPWSDTISTHILEKMYVEEIGHQNTAKAFTHQPLHPLLVGIMIVQSKLMTHVALYL